MPFQNPALKLLPAIFLCFCLVIQPCRPRAAAAPLPRRRPRFSRPPRPARPPAYAPGGPELRPPNVCAERDRDCLQKIALAKRLLDVRRLVELRRQTLALMASGMEINWEYLRTRRFANGDRVGVTLSVPVWVPARAQKLQTYCGFEKKWQIVAQTTPRKSGCVWFDPSLTSIIRPPTGRQPSSSRSTASSPRWWACSWSTSSGRAITTPPGACRSCRCERRGHLCGERPHPGDAGGVPQFSGQRGRLLAAIVACALSQNLAEIFHGHHAPGSNHRLGLALDLNDFNYPGVVDGVPNPISRSIRQYNRDAMYKLDARQMPAWVYGAAKWPGMRLPQEWTYPSALTPTGSTWTWARSEGGVASSQ